EVAGRVVAARRREHHERLEPARKAEEAGAGGDEDETIHALRVPVRELLRQRAAPRDPEEIDDAIAEDVERFHEEARQAAEAPRQDRRRRAPGAGDVDGDGLDAREAGAERREELEAGADAVHEEERAPVAPALDRYAQANALDLDEVGGFHLSARPGGRNGRVRP